MVAGNPHDFAKAAALAVPTERAPFIGLVRDFYLSNSIARASVLMAKLSLMAQERIEKATGTHG